MKFQKTPFALAAIALCSAMPLGAQTTSVTIQAEGMTLSSYAVENGNRIKLTSSSGTATKTFSGAKGTYNVQVYVAPETDGQSTLEVYKGSTLLQKYTYPLSNTATSFTIKNVALNSGETIKLLGRTNAGAIARVDKIVLTPVATSTTTASPDSGYKGTPYSGSPVALPKAFPAANFDKGGQGVAYNDLTKGNAGGLYRTAEDVDITASTDPQGGAYAVNNVQTGEWLAYTVNVPANGNYDLAIRAANNQTSPATFHIQVDGVNVTGSVTVPQTGSWSTYQWLGKQGVNLTAGKRVLKVVSNQQYFNLNAVSVLASSAPAPSPTPTPSPYGVYFKAPVANAELSSPINQSSACEVAGTGIAAVQFFLDTTALNTDSAGPWQCNLDTTKFADGTHTLKAVATYTDGKTGTAQIAINIKNPTPPPAPTPAPSSGTVQFSCSFEISPTDCGFVEQAKVMGRATLVNTSRTGTKGVRLHTEPGDNNVSGSGDRERNDLRLPVAASDCSEGREQWWAHSILFPNDYQMPPAGTGGLVADFHHTGSTGQANVNLKAMPEGLRIQVAGGPTVATSSTSPGVSTGVVGPIVKNVWYDFVYHVKWSSGSDGYFYAWLNGVQKIAHRGATLYAGQSCYFKLANYHSATGEPTSVIHDRVIRGTSAGAVSLTPLQGVQ